MTHRSRTPSLPARLFAAFALAAAGGCVHELPPPEEPEEEIDERLRRRALETSGGERAAIVLDIVDGAGTIEDLGSEADGARAETICETTPCVALLAPGDHRLVFHHQGRDDQVEVRVGPGPRAHRRVMSYDSGEHQEYLGLAISGFVIGGAFLPILGPLTQIDGNDLQPHDGGIIAATVFMGAAITTGIIGVILAITDPQETRRGVSLEWDLVP
ncbi:MAG: hypothetical protein KC619_34420 [Myxococcales bacterium]|nr:hypothetical protein [Myxococcales bacterium]